MRRREYVHLVAAGGLGSIAGCVATGPDPEVIDAEAEADFFDVIAGQAKVEVTVVDNGSDGEVVVFVELYGEEGTTLGRYGDEIFLREDERRRVTIRLGLDEDAETFQGFAEPAE